MSVLKLITQEGWNTVQTENGYFVETELGLLKAKHPALLHLELYGKHTDPEKKYQHMKRGHDLLWPNTVWHEWTEDRFRAHCGQDSKAGQWNYITLAAGASASKSYDVAKIAILFWYANPQGRNVTIASVTLTSLLTRVWGYVTKHIRSMAVDLPYKYYSASPPKILFDDQVKEASGSRKIKDDTLHGIFAVTAQKGDDDQAVATWIGKHPDDRILLILDEATDMPMSILNALPNLNSHPDKFQLIGIGNSDSTMDLHGLLSTPKNGWDSVSPELKSWETTQLNGICLYFSPYQSPAVLDPDPERRKILENFLMGRSNLKAKEEELGKDSEKFYRWVLGFWKSRNTEDVTVSEGFLKDFSPRARVEWSGHYPLTYVAGLDPAFSVGGDKCVLSIGQVGHATDNKMKINFALETMMFEIELLALKDKSVERQIAEKAVDILIRYQVPLENLAIDITGQGRAIGEVVAMENTSRGSPLGFGTPLKIYSMGQHNQNKRKRSYPDIVTISSYDLWITMRKYIEQGQVCSLDSKTITQMTSRLILDNGRTKKLETKREYKRRMSAIGMGHSPDEADSRALCFQVLKLRLGIEPGAMKNAPSRPLSVDRMQTKIDIFKGGLDRPRAVVELPEAGFTDDLVNHIKYSSPF